MDRSNHAGGLVVLVEQGVEMDLYFPHARDNRIYISAVVALGWISLLFAPKER